MKLLNSVFEELNKFIAVKNMEIALEGGAKISKQKIKVVGQVALLFAKLPFPVSSTMDLDIASPCHHEVVQKLETLLLEQGMRLEIDPSSKWMPAKTHYTLMMDLPWVEVYVADAQSVMISKYKLKRQKDRGLLDAYVKHDPEFQRRLKMESL